jgi:hypothetical protein
MEGKKISQETQDLLTIYQSLFFDLPTASLRWGLGLGEEKDTAQAAWKAYDAGVRLATTAVDTLYRTAFFSETVSIAVNQALRWQQVGNTVSSVFLGSLWRTLGLPTAAEVQSLANQLRTLEARVGDRLPHEQNQSVFPPLSSPETPLNGTSHSFARKKQRQEARAVM